MFLLTFALFLLIKTSSGSSILNMPDRLTTISIPENKELELALGYNKEALMNFTELTALYGYPTSKHSVETDDGYKLNMFRINSNKTVTMKPTPVLLMHGLLDSSDTWIVGGPEVGLAYILADQGYDVWCGNNRGNYYARKHVTLNPDKDPAFWDFTFHQHGIYDVPAMIDYILNKTSSEQVAFVGHSQGTTDMLVLLSNREEYNRKIKIAAFLAPVAWLYNSENVFLRTVAKLKDEVQLIYKVAGVKEVLGSKELTAALLKLLCQYLPKTICGSIFTLVTGSDPKYVTRKAFQVIFGHYPRGTSIDNLACYADWLSKDSFSRCDLGEKKNMEQYGSIKAADYNLTAVTAPVALYYGNEDKLVSKKDMPKLRQNLSNVVRDMLMAQSDWGHGDFIWSSLVPQFMVPELVNLFDQFNV